MYNWGAIMAILRLFHQRKQDKKLALKKLSYDDIPNEVRVKIVYLLARLLGKYVVANPWDYGLGEEMPRSNQTWDLAEEELREALGKLSIGSSKDQKANYSSYILSSSVEEALSAVELAFLYGEVGYEKIHEDDWQREKSEISTTPEKARDEINELFKIYKIGYQLLDGKIVRIDSEYLHKETVEKVTDTLAELHFEGPIQEFRKALDHHRKGNPEDALNWANRAFESTMKAICDERGWKYPSKTTAGKLIPIIVKNLLPAYFNPQLGGTKAILEALPAVRGQVATHGDGKIKKEIPIYVTSYAIHQSAATILLLVNAHKQKKNP